MENVPEPYRTLFEAVSSDCRPEIIPELMGKGAKLDYIDPNNGRTPLYAAVRANRIRAVEALLRHQADPNQRFSYRSPVDGTLENNRVVLHYVLSPEMTTTLLNGGANVNTTDAIGTTPLMCAAFHGNLLVVRTLLAAGADVSVRQDKQHVRRAPNARELVEVKIKFLQNALRLENRDSTAQRLHYYENIRTLLLQAESAPGSPPSP
jgi:ankyrin repeat protein